MRIRLSNGPVVTEERARRIHQRQGTANPLFWNILLVSSLFPRFCGCKTLPFCVSTTESIFWLLRRKNSSRWILQCGRDMPRRRNDQQNGEAGEQPHSQQVLEISCQNQIQPDNCCRKYQTNQTLG